MDISGEDDYKLIKRENMRVDDGEHIFRPETFTGYINKPYPEPPIFNPSPCDNGWEPPERTPIPYGSQRIIIDEKVRIGYVEFYYEKVIE